MVGAVHRIPPLKDEDFQRVDVEATQTVDIQDFVDLDEIDPIYFYKPYYLEPQKGGDKAYALLRDSLEFQKRRKWENANKKAA
ncbi:MAG TPA: Ku protein [Chthoniobacterales bacterium]|nr:Ku protein [Chthoniobacterales bacterium]